MKRVYPCAAWRIFCGSSPRIGNSSVKPDPLFVIVPQRQSTDSWGRSGNEITTHSSREYPGFFIA
ncbi:hypothetical protein EBF40_19960, partial [Salmonella enterica]|nr:hypothetical protein [Salmonella enterica]EAN3023095.1 hypothetical protein [Salmonella enterica]